MSKNESGGLEKLRRFDKTMVRFQKLPHYVRRLIGQRTIWARRFMPTVTFDFRFALFPRKPWKKVQGYFSTTPLHRQLYLMRLVLPILVGAFLIGIELFEHLAATSTGFSIYALGELFMFAVVIPVGLWGIITLIERSWHNREQAEAKIREHEQYLASITSASADAIISLDRQGRLRTWNHGAELIFGYQADDVLGHSFGKILHTPDEASGLWERIEQEFFERGFVRNYETDATTKAGNRIWIDLTQTVLYDAHREIIGSALVVRDITQARQAQEEIRQLNIDLERKVEVRTRSLQAAYHELEHKNVELQKLDRMKSDFVSLVSHELRAPLTNINGGLELILEASDLSPHIQKTLTIIRQQSTRLTTLVESILDITRLEAGRMPLRLGPLAVGPVLRNVAREMVTRAPNHDFTWPDTGDFPLLWADEERLTDILFNVLDNAVKYSEPGSNIQIEVTLEADDALFSINDCGHGMTFEEQGHIFDKFYRGDTRDAREVYGQGLGLYLTRKLVEAQGGQIKVTSQPGQGTQFTFTLPLAENGE
ncbi:MAG: ATP-binding protein [Anaerolineae bacterium]|nr:ATP-binding protein [Anaerolineae bacterium]